MRSLTIESFRGFRDSASFDLDASAIIFTGPNGTGKTSVFDALQWVLLGSIKRLEALRARSTVEHVVSRFREGERARVSLVVDIDGQEFTLTRTGDRRGSSLEIAGLDGGSLFGGLASDWLDSVLVHSEPGSLSVALATCGLLQQDVMRSVLEAKPAERFAHISAVLGLGDLEDFEQQAKDSLKEVNDRKSTADRLVLAARGTVDGLEERVELLENRALTRASVEVVRTQLAQLLDDHSRLVAIDVPKDISPQFAIEDSVRLRRLAEGLESYLNAHRRLVEERHDLTPTTSDDDYERLQREESNAVAAADQAATEVETLAEQLRVAESAAADVARLASAALPLLSERCPVCDQAIEQAQVERRLIALSSESDTLIQLRARLATKRQEVSVSASELNRASEALAGAQRNRDAWTTHGEQVSASAERGQKLVNEPALIGTDVDWLIEQGALAADSLREIAAVYERYSDVLTENQSTGELDRARAELASAGAALSLRQEEAAAASTRASRMKQLAEASSEARLAVTKSRFEAIEPLVSDIYRRLDPHPAFKGLGFEHDVHYKRGTSTAVVSDPIAGVEADPLIVFSASQANIAALSYFLAMGLGAGDRSLPFILLDDPLQSMDDVNVLGFADLCRFLRSNRQLILSTHDRRFANLLRRKLDPRSEGDRTMVFEFTGWDRRGPIVKSDSEDFQPGSRSFRLLASSA